MSASSPTPPTLTTVTTVRILLVEDDADLRDVLQALLESQGYSVGAAGDGLEALSRLDLEPFDLVVTDYRMPRMDGMALITSLRADPAHGGLPVVLTSGELPAGGPGPVPMR